MKSNKRKKIVDDRFLKSLKRMGLKLNDENVVKIGVGNVPLFVIFAIGLGNTFGFPIQPNEINIDEFKLAFERIGDEISEFGTLNKWKAEVKSILQFISGGKFGSDNDQDSCIQVFIGRQFAKTIEFLKQNPNIIVLQADKGGKIVVVNRSLYESKMNDYLQDCVNNRTYFKCTSLSLEDVAFFVEGKYDCLRSSLNEFLIKDAEKGLSNLCYPLSFQPYVIPRIYGNIKVHKENFPVRPIISSINHLGGDLMDWLLVKLNVISEHLNLCKIKNSTSLFDALNGHHLKDGLELVTWDYDSMYTNIPIAVTKEIIRNNYHLLENVTTVPVEIFLEAVSFFTEHSTYFVHNTGIFRQCRGLAMGNSLSQVLAEIVTRSRMIEAVKKFSKEDVYFLGIYVDDILGIIHRDRISDVENEILKNDKFLKLKIVRENERNEVNFLNATIQRSLSGKNGNEYKVLFKWYYKECSAQRILDYHSSHPLSMKRNVCDEYIRNALLVSDESNWKETTEKLWSFFDASHYPKRFTRNRFFDVKRRMNVSRREGVVQSKDVNRVYISFPFSREILGRSKFLIRKLALKKRITLSPKIVRGMKRNILTNLKNKVKMNSIINATAIARCKNCKFSCRISTQSYDLQRSFNHLKCNGRSVIARHLNEFPDHVFDSLCDIKAFRSKYELKLMLNSRI